MSTKTHTFKVAGVYINLGEDEAALIIYTDSWHKGKQVSVIGNGVHEAFVAERYAHGGRRSYVAVFKRIPLRGSTSLGVSVYGDPVNSLSNHSVTLYAGNFTEIDARKPRT